MSSKLKLHARRRAARFGDLDALLAAALLEQRRGEGAVKRIKGINAAIHEAYSNPSNWTERGVVMVLYVDERTGQQETVGLFQESVHRTGARKLTRVVVADSERVHQEIYHDPFLVRGKVDPCPPVAPDKDPLAQMAIRAYLQRQRESVKLEDFLGGDAKAKIDARKLLNELHKMQLAAEV